MRQYHELLLEILEKGNHRGDRTGTGTQSIFGYQFRHDLSEGFPLLTTKKLPWKSIVVELLWFLKGDTNIKYLLENDVHIWTADAYRMYKRAVKVSYIDEKIFEKCILEQPEFARTYGDLGPVYGKQWRRWVKGEVLDGETGEVITGTYIDQIANVIESIKANPDGRRHIVTAWNPPEIDSMALPPCHCLFQFYVHDGKLSCQLYQRSADVFLGVPFNIASYALLTHIIAHQTGLVVGDFIHVFGDVHIYNNHHVQVMELLGRELRGLPTLEIIPADDRVVWNVEQYEYDDFRLLNYNPHPPIKADLSVGV